MSSNEQVVSPNFYILRKDEKYFTIASNVMCNDYLNSNLVSSVSFCVVVLISNCPQCSHYTRLWLGFRLELKLVNMARHCENVLLNRICVYILIMKND